MKKLVRFLATAAAAFALYLVLTMSVELPEILLGIGVAVITTLVVVRFLPIGIHTFNPVRILLAVVYAPVFIWKMIAANLHIAGVVIRPRLRIRPSIVKAKTGLTNPNGKLILTSSITLTPGTLSVDTKDDDVYVHLVDTPAETEEEARKRIIEPFEKHIRGIAK